MNKKKIYFIENSFDYNGSDLDNPKIGGSEKTLINITNALAKDNKILVKVFNNTSKPNKINNVFWNNIGQIDNSDKADFVIAMSDSNLFNRLKRDTRFNYFIFWIRFFSTGNNNI